jgi:hypothetical protein
VSDEWREMISTLARAFLVGLSVGGAVCGFQGKWRARGRLEAGATKCAAPPALRWGLGFSLVADGDGGRGEEGAEVAGGESVQGAQAGFEFGRGYAAQAIEAA